MTDLVRCDLGDGVEVIHDVESIEVEMECDVDDALPAFSEHTESLLKIWLESHDETERVQRHWFEPEPEVVTSRFTRTEDIGTHPFVRYSAPYERIEIQLDTSTFRLATIEEAKALARRHDRVLRRARRALPA